MSGEQLRWRIEVGRWQPVLPGVYRIEGAPRVWLQELKAACLWAARGVAVSHRAAAALWRLARFKEGVVELSVTRRMRPAGQLVLHRVRELRGWEVGSVSGVPVTSPTRTLLDLAAAEDFPTVRASVDECLRRKLTSLDRLAEALRRADGRRGVRALRELVAEYLGGVAPTESELEAMVFDLLEAAGLPMPQKQRVVIVRGRLRRLDFSYTDAPVVIEADGYASHSDPIAFEKDTERRNALTSRGYLVLHFTYKALRNRPEELVDDVRRTLAGVLGARACAAAR